MEIKVLGMGCAKCRSLVAEAEKALAQSGRPGVVEKVEDMAMITAFGVMRTPALVVNGRVKCSGRVPTAKEIGPWLNEA